MLWAGGPDSSDRGGSQASCPRRSPGPHSPGELLRPHSLRRGASPASPGVPWAGSSGQYWSCMYCSTSVLPSGSLSSGGAAAGHLLLPLHLHQPVELHGCHGVFFGRVPVLAHLDLLVQQLQGQVLKRDTIPDVEPWLAELCPN